MIEKIRTVKKPGLSEYEKVLSKALVYEQKQSEKLRERVLELELETSELRLRLQMIGRTRRTVPSVYLEFFSRPEFAR